jgi:nicotinate phosphoribosyltransferase
MTIIDTPIITSLLDLDFYKLTMGQLIWKHHADNEVKLSSKNRTTRVQLAKCIDYLRALKIFEEGYLDFLAKLQLPEIEINVHDGQYVIDVQNKWAYATWWETIELCILNELYYRNTVDDIAAAHREGRRRLKNKIEVLNRDNDIKIIEFGTRRRFSQLWQEEVTTMLASKLKDNLLGTSNVRLAMILGLKPIGTYAHELDMGYSGKYRAQDDEAGTFVSHQIMMRDWWNMYGYELSIALPDTYGTVFFRKYFSDEEARDWKGQRHDSGDPIEFGDSLIADYKRRQINPREKTLVFSDGLDLPMILKLHKHFMARIRDAYGWGTNLTNDLGPAALSLVAKIVRSNGYGTVKLPDNLAKATGLPEDIERAKRFTGNNVTNYVECKV